MDKHSSFSQRCLGKSHQYLTFFIAFPNSNFYRTFLWESRGAGSALGSGPVRAWVGSPILNWMDPFARWPTCPSSPGTSPGSALGAQGPGSRSVLGNRKGWSLFSWQSLIMSHTLNPLPLFPSPEVLLLAAAGKGWPHSLNPTLYLCL